MNLKGIQSNDCDQQARITELERLLAEERERRMDAESRLAQLDSDKQQSTLPHGADNQSLFEDLLNTTHLVERIHDKLAGVMEDFGEGFAAKVFELRNTPASIQVDPSGSTIPALSEVLNGMVERLSVARSEIRDAVAVLKSAVEDKTRPYQSSEDSYKSIFRRVKDGVFIADSDWNITDINPAMCEMLGYQYRRLAMDLNIRDDVFPDSPDFELLEKNIIVSGYCMNHETRLTRADGGELEVIVSCTAIWGEDDTLAGFEGVVHDMTENKKLELERVNLHRLEAVHNMVITVNHNMNQNLTVIYNYSQLLRERMDPESEHIPLLKTIHMEVEKLIELLRRITKIEQVKTTEYIDGVQMIDLDRSVKTD